MKLHIFHFIDCKRDKGEVDYNDRSCISNFFLHNHVINLLKVCCKPSIFLKF